MSKFDGSRGPPEISGMYSLKVDNLTYRTTGEDLERYFKKYGDVGDIYIPRDRNTQESRGFAFVRFYEEKDAEDAMDSCDGKVIDGREIRVALARYGRPTNPYDPKKQGYGNRRDGRSAGYNRDRGHRGDRDRRRSPRRRRSNSRSRSRSRSRTRRRSRSRSRSPRKHHRRSYSRSPKRSPRRSRSPKRSRSRSPKRSTSPKEKSRSPARKSRSISPRKSEEKEKSRSRSRSKSRHSDRDDN